MIKKLIRVCAILQAVICAQAEAIDGIVTSVNGSASLQAAIEAANEGDVILVGPGTYSPIRTNGKKITIKSTEGAASTIIDGGSANRCATLADVALEEEEDGIVIEGSTLVGFTLMRGYNRCVEGVTEICTDGGAVFGGTVVNCIIKDSESYLIEDGFEDGCGGGACRAALYNCLITGNTAALGAGASDCILYNCTVVANVNGACPIGYSKAYNCIISGGGILDTWNSTYNNCLAPSGEYPTTALMGGDMKFVDPSIGDYRLQQGSAAIDAGTSAYVQSLNSQYGDLDGNVRVRDTVDIGAYECIKEKYSYYENGNGEIVLTDIIGDVPENWVCPSMYEGKKVVGLGDHFLAESEEVRSVVLADTIREVGEKAFKKCPNLSSVILNEGLEIIRGYAFRKCFSLESVILPSSISIVEERAFCRSGENYRWDEGDGIGIQRIEIRGGENDAFSCEDGVLYDKINKKVIMARANIERVVLPEDCTRIGDCAFLSCYNLKEVVWNTALSEIGDEAFAGTYLTIGDLSKTSLVLAQEQAFAGCSLKEVVFPATLRTVGSHLFGLCDSLESVRFLGNAPEIDNSAEETEEGFPAGDIYVTISSGSVEDVYDIYLPNVTTFVEKGTSGWGTVPGTWQGCPINYWSMGTDPIPSLGALATASEVAAALEGSVDAKLAANIKTATEYMAYRTWALGLEGVTPREVKDSPNAWLSFALDADELIVAAPKEGDVVINTFESAANAGAFEFTVKIDGIEVGENALEANIRKVFDIEGAEKLASGGAGFSSDNVEVSAAAPENGNVKFTVTPKGGGEGTRRPTSFFFCVKMK